MTELEKMDALKARFDITYEQAKEALEAEGWDLEKAALRFEAGPAGESAGASAGEGGEKKAGDVENTVREIIRQIKEIIQEGNVTQVRLKNKERTLLEVPATLGVIGLSVMLFSPLTLALTAVGAIAAISSELTFEIEKSDGSIETRELKWT